MSENENTKNKAVCMDCGNTWTPRNTAGDNHKRKCSKCGSEKIKIESPKADEPKDKATTSKEIAALINTPPSAEKAEKEKTDNTKQETAEVKPDISGGLFPKLHPTLIIIVFAFILSFGAFLYFRGRVGNTRKKSRKEVKEPDNSQTTRPIKKIGIPGL